MDSDRGRYFIVRKGSESLVHCMSDIEVSNTSGILDTRMGGKSYNNGEPRCFFRQHGGHISL